jgi:hypothetical protein
MKKLLILPLLVFLTGCVTYYYPETALEDGVYYAKDDPSYTGYSGGYSGAFYYPWSSLDYFYLGYYPYHRYGYGYNNGFSFGIGYGYSPWYYPTSYYGFYAPRYRSYYHYPYYSNRRHYNGYNSSPVRRYVSTVPSGYSGNQGMVVRNRGNAKVGKSQLHPVKPVSTRAVSVTSSGKSSRSHSSARPSRSSSLSHRQLKKSSSSRSKHRN